MYKNISLRVCTALLIATTAPAAFGAPEQPATACERTLDAAQKLEADHFDGKVQQAIQTYETAFGLCERADASPELTARIDERRAHYARFFDHDLSSAIDLYREGLTRATVALGEDHPARVGLLDGLASALESRASQGSSPVADEAEVVELRQEALRVRRAAYGDTSRECAKGWVMLSVANLEQRPALAESQARRAVEIATRAAGGADAQVAEAWSALELALRQQGKIYEADAARDQATEIYGQLRDSGRPLGGVERGQDTRRAGRRPGASIAAYG